MTIIADLLELHHPRVPAGETAAACLTSFERVEEILRDAELARGNAPEPYANRQRSALRQPSASPKADDEPSFGDQCLRHMPDLVRYAQSLTPDRETAEDLVQDTLLIALENQHRFMRGTNLCGWLVTIMHNQRINGVRRTIRAAKMMDLMQLPEAVSASQESDAEFRELGRAFGKLSEDKRKVLLLAHCHGLSYGEIADTMKIPLSTVGSKMARGRSLLRRMTGRDAIGDASGKKLQPRDMAGAAPGRLSE